MQKARVDVFRNAINWSANHPSQHDITEIKPEGEAYFVDGIREGDSLNPRNVETHEILKGRQISGVRR